MHTNAICSTIAVVTLGGLIMTASTIHGQLSNRIAAFSMPQVQTSVASASVPTVSARALDAAIDAADAGVAAGLVRAVDLRDGLVAGTVGGHLSAEAVSKLTAIMGALAPRQVADLLAVCERGCSIAR